MLKKSLKLLLAICVIYPALSFAGPAYPACVVACWAACGALVAVPAPTLPAEIMLCIKGCTALCVWSCFADDTSIIVLEDGMVVKKSIREVRQGDMVRTLKYGKLAWTKVIGNIKTGGGFEFIQIYLLSSVDNSYKQLKVTPAHGVVLMREGEQAIIDMAENVEIGDKMINTDGTISIVSEVNRLEVQDKYTLETSDGTVLASDIFVSTICDKEIVGNEQSFDSKLEDWQKRHADFNFRNDGDDRDWS